MKTLKLLYNPASGDKQFKNAIDDCAGAFQAAGYETHLLRAATPEMLDESISGMNEDIIVAAGGDGTVNLVVNALMRHKKEMPMGIIPAGTANDFAAYLKMPKEPKAAAEAIMNGRVMRADLGLVNGRYFINVCGAGLLANVSQQVDVHFKDAMGKLAYYIKGLGQLPNFVPIPLRITTASSLLEDDFFFFTVLNGSGAGGFDKLSATAKIDDGKLDFIGFKAMSVIDVAALFLKVLAGDHLDDRRVMFLRAEEFLVEHIAVGQIDTDIDGETGPEMPLRISCQKEAIEIFVPHTYR